VLNKKYNYKSLNELPDGFKIGTSSLRRIATIKSKFPKLELHNIRGNLNTRISKLDEG
jgi:hydroxymethylbilane synthase